MKWKVPITAIRFVEFILIIWLVVINTRYITSLTPWQVAKGNEERYLADARGLGTANPTRLDNRDDWRRYRSYFLHDRTIVNLDGLMNSAEYLQALQANRGAEFLDRMGLTFINASE